MTVNPRVILFSIGSLVIASNALAQTTAVAKTHRWVDWQSASFDARYRFIENSEGHPTTDQVQDRQTLKAGLRLDEAGRYSVQTFVGTGNSFVGSWDPLGPGTGDTTWDPNVRQLFLAARPIDGLEIEVGGFGIVRGESTEITSFDYDGYMTGERVTIGRPRQLYLDEIAVTAGFLGDLATPNVFHRMDRLDDHNYTQVLAAKRFGSRVRASADWTSLDGISTIREAVRVETKTWAPVDAVRLEQYQRVEGVKAAGFAVSAERALTRRVAVDGGFANIDRGIGALNGDRFSPGRRVFGEARVAVLPALSVTMYYGVAIDNALPVPNKHRVDVIASWNVLRSLQGAGLW
jgi:hypothetical protein